MEKLQTKYSNTLVNTKPKMFRNQKQPQQYGLFEVFVVKFERNKTNIRLHNNNYNANIYTMTNYIIYIILYM